jgi:hypothetical protein
MILGRQKQELQVPSACSPGRGRGRGRTSLALKFTPLLQHAALAASDWQ